jgi:beta-lactam-binding protein with PASTA domain
VLVVPDVADRRLSEAFDALHRVGLRPVLIGMPTHKTDGNLGYRVAAQEPGAGVEVKEGARVALALDTIALSIGGHGIEGPPVAVKGTLAPDVVGVELEEAMALVTREGLIAVVFQPRRGVEQITISRQEPEPRIPVGPFREVGLWLD